MGNRSGSMGTGGDMRILEINGTNGADMVGRYNGRHGRDRQYKNYGGAHTTDMERGGEEGVWRYEGIHGDSAGQRDRAAMEAAMRALGKEREATREQHKGGQPSTKNAIEGMDMGGREHRGGEECTTVLGRMGVPGAMGRRRGVMGKGDRYGKRQRHEDGDG